MTKSLYDFCLEHGEPELLAQWDEQKNGTLTARDVTKGSHKKIWWTCAFGHSWQAVVYTRTYQHSGCPYCAGRLLLPFAQSLADEYPELVKQWHPDKNHGLTPRDVVSGSHRRVWWRCEQGHEWLAQIKSRVHRRSDCPYCKNKRVLAGFNDLATLEPQIAEQWHPQLNEPLTAQMVTPGSAKKVWWQCPDGHIWQAVVYSRTRENKCGCPVCAGKVKQSKQLRSAEIMSERLKNK